MNTRHPFSRLFAAWSDKFRTHSNGTHTGTVKDFHFEVFVNATAPLNSYASFNKSDKAISFPAFLDYIAAADEERYNRHWKSSYWTCSPCQFEYNYILHLEEAEEESTFLFNELGLETHLPNDHASASEKIHEPSWYYQEVSRETLEEVYRSYFLDFITLGYTAESVLSYLHPNQNKVKPPSTRQKEEVLTLLEPFVTWQRKKQKIAQYAGCNQPHPDEEAFFANFTKRVSQNVFEIRKLSSNDPDSS